MLKYTSINFEFVIFQIRFKLWLGFYKFCLMSQVVNDEHMLNILSESENDNDRSFHLMTRNS